MVAVHGARHRHLGLASLHKLQQRHLCRGILHRNAVRTEVNIRLTALKFGHMCSIKQVGVQNLLSQCKRVVQHLAGSLHTARKIAVHLLYHLNIESHFSSSFGFVLYLRLQNYEMCTDYTTNGGYFLVVGVECWVLSVEFRFNSPLESCHGERSRTRVRGVYLEVPFRCAGRS